MKTYILLDKDDHYRPSALLHTNSVSKEEIQKAIDITRESDYTSECLEENMPDGVAIEWLDYKDPLIW